MNVSQGSILGLILYNLSINDLFFFVIIVSLYSFADDNTPSEFATIILELNALLETESEIIMN